MSELCIEASVDRKYSGVTIWFYVHTSLTLPKQPCIPIPPLLSLQLRSATSYSLNQTVRFI